MSNLYKATAGSVVRDQVSSPSFLSVDGFDGQLRGGKMIATAFHVDRGQGWQMMKTLSNAIYTYAFGEDPGKIRVGGLLFLVNCGSAGASARAIGDVNAYYEKSNMYARKGPVRVAADGASYRTYLTEMSIVLEQNQYNYGSFSLGFLLIPEN